MDATRLGDFFDGGSPMDFFGFLGSFMGDFVGDGGSFLSAGAFVFLFAFALTLYCCFADRPCSIFLFWAIE